MFISGTHIRVSDDLEKYQGRRIRSKLFAQVISRRQKLPLARKGYRQHDVTFRNTTRVSNGLDPDQDRRLGGPDMCPNYLQKLADEKSRL